MVTVAASFDMTAEGGGAAGLDGAHGLKLFERERVVVAVGLAVMSEKIAQLKTGPGHASGFGLAGVALLAEFGQCVQRRSSHCL